MKNLVLLFLIIILVGCSNSNENRVLNLQEMGYEKGFDKIAHYKSDIVDLTNDWGSKKMENISVLVVSKNLYVQSINDKKIDKLGGIYLTRKKKLSLVTLSYKYNNNLRPEDKHVLSNHLHGKIEGDIELKKGEPQKLFQAWYVEKTFTENPFRVILLFLLPFEATVYNYSNYSELESCPMDNEEKEKIRILLDSYNKY